MFTIPCSESYGFDFLSIYEVKIKKNGGEKAVLNFNQTADHILKQIGIFLFNNILNSEEYKNLVRINTELFDLVDAVKHNPCLGKEIDSQVYKRFLAKKALQEKFFPESEITEQKIGY